jgi:predicted DNA-binding ribbon-helix-helix protein
LEDLFWSSLKDIAHDRKVTLSQLIGGIDARRQNGNLSSAIRLFVLDHYRRRHPSDFAQRVDTDRSLDAHSALRGDTL